MRTNGRIHAFSLLKCSQSLLFGAPGILNPQKITGFLESQNICYFCIFFPKIFEGPRCILASQKITDFFLRTNAYDYSVFCP
jgi:hypothetical protein